MNVLKEKIINSFRVEFAVANLMLSEEGMGNISQNTIDSIVNIIETIVGNQIEESQNGLTLNQLTKDAVHCKAA